MGIARKKILIAGDDDGFMMALSAVLGRMGFEVIPVDLFAELLRLAGKATPDIIFLTIKTAETDWAPIIRGLRRQELTATTPLIIACDEMQRDIYDDCLKLGISGFLRIPVDLYELNDLIWNVVVLPGGRRRKLLRVTFDQKILLTHAGSTLNYEAVSLSEGGLFVRQQKPLPMGSEVEVSLPLNEGPMVRIGGMVIDKREDHPAALAGASGIAIGFQNLNQDESRLLKAYIVRLLAGDILRAQKEAYLTIRGPSDGSPP